MIQLYVWYTDKINVYIIHWFEFYNTFGTFTIYGMLVIRVVTFDVQLAHNVTARSYFTAYLKASQHQLSIN